MPSEVSASATTAVINTPQALGSDIVTPGVYQLYVDCSQTDVGDGDVVDFTSYLLVNSTFSSVQLITKDTFTATASGPKAYRSDPFVALFQLHFELNQTAGVAKDFYWSVVRLDA